MNTSRRHSLPAQPSPADQRTGVVLMIVALLLPVLLGVTGLVLDSGLMMAAHRKSRNAADAAALAAAKDLVEGKSLATAKATATTFVQQYNGMKSATVTVHNPPASGPYAGQSNYIEVLVSQPVSTALIHILGAGRNQTVSARAVAGFELAPSAADVITLNPDARPGLSITGNGNLKVNGVVAINSEGGGVDEHGKPVESGNSGVAASVSNHADIIARRVQVVGGVNNPSNFRNYDPNDPANPLKANSLPQADPFRYLPPPTTANGADPTEWPAVHISGNKQVTLYPGVYPSMRINSGNVTLDPGIYVIRGGDLRITDPDVRAEGVMFYMTGSDYNVNTGLPDSSDIDRAPPASGNPSFGSVTINAGVNLTGLSDPASPFHGLLFYQRRLNTEEFSTQGNSSSGNLAGTIYAKWASMKLAGQGVYNAQFVVDSITITGNGDVTITETSSLIGQAHRIYLVE